MIRVGEKEQILYYFGILIVFLQTEKIKKRNRLW